jgi:polyhydroxybutyrate depolymerase
MHDRRFLGRCGWLWSLPLLGLVTIACGSSNGPAGNSGGATDSGGFAGSHDQAGTGGVSDQGGTGGPGGIVGTGGGTAATGSGTNTGVLAGAISGDTTGSGGATGSSGAGAAAKPSAGCSATSKPASGRATIDVSGTSREYILTLPAQYNPSHPYRLIFAFHGGKYNAQSVTDGGPPGSGPYYGIQAEAKDTAIFVAPQATTSSWSSTDVAYIKAMVTRFESELCVDRNRIFATGFSMGAIMTLTLGCGSADIFRAIAPMSGSITGTCTGTQPIAYWSSHATNDPSISYASGQSARNTFMTRNHCSTQTQAGSPAGCVNYQGCDPGYPVVWCSFDGVHEPAPFAGSAIWAFISQF